MNGTTEAPIFVVGSSRSGTTLTRAVLNGHSRIHICNETHYFDDLRPRLRDPGAALVGPGLGRIQAYFSALTTQLYGLTQGGSPAAATPATTIPVAADPVSADQAFAAHCRAEAAREGKAIWGEKTPRHLFRVADILEVFPAARIVIVVRAPQGVVASHRDWARAWVKQFETSDLPAGTVRREARRLRRSYNLTLIALLWRSAAKVARAMPGRYGSDRVFVLRFEDLLGAPETSVSALAAWLGIEFEQRMLDVVVVNSSDNRRHLRAGIDKGASEAWRGALSGQEAAFVDLICGDVAERMGYERTSERVHPAFLLGELLKAPAAMVRAAAANRGRIGNLAEFLAGRLSGLMARPT
jgi:hypothetical protein